MVHRTMSAAHSDTGTGDERDVYLPVSENWVDYFTGEKVESGHIKVSTKGIPVYRKI